MSYMIWPVVLLENLFYLLSGFTMLVLAGDKLVETAVRMARKWKVPASVVAVTIIAAGTSAPELFTSLVASFRAESDIAVGNVIGSNIFNILAVGGLSLMLQPFGSISQSLMSWLFLIAGSLVFFFSMNDLKLGQTEGIVFVGALLAFIVVSFFQEREKDSTFENLESKSFSRTVGFFLVSLFGLIMGAELALRGGVGIGEYIGLSQRVIAITIISVGTGLPELATSVAAAYRGHSDIAIANVIGSNVFNTLAIPGTTALFFPLAVDENFLSLDFYVMSAATLFIGTLFLIKSENIRRILGGLMFLAYSGYATFILLNP